MSKLFNVAVENVVWHWLSMAMEDDAFIHDGMRHTVGRIMGVDGLIGWQDLEWLHGALEVLISLFLQIGLMANIAKSKTMMRQPSTIR